MSTKRRLPQAESRLAALAAAREVLLEQGPQAVTLKAVASRIGRTHANLLHHFGSASGLQAALTEYLAKDICATIGEAVAATQEGAGSPREVVDLIFDAFEQGRGLMSWLLLSGDDEALTPVVEEIARLVARFEDLDRVREASLLLTVMAMGDAQIGGRLSASLALPRSTARDSAELILRGALERTRDAQG